MSIFDLRQSVIDEYSKYVQSFLSIADERVRAFIEESLLRNQALWPDALLQLNPSYEMTLTIQDLVAEGKLHPLCGEIFRADGAEPIRLYRHQQEAIEKALNRKHFVVTSGTGSGKTLTYFVPIFHAILGTNPEQAKTRAIIVYPMNALVNSQEEALRRLAIQYKNLTGQECPVRFSKYTGQERGQEKENIQKNPPHILLTNYVMLELMLLRPEEHNFVDKTTADLQFLVVDELHTYRGRQGADVGLLIRRLRERSGNQSLQCIGTSATMVAGKSTSKRERQVAVAEFAGKIFGVTVEPDCVIEESLKKVTSFIGIPSADVLRNALKSPLPETVEEMTRNPVAAWIEHTFGTEEEPDGHLRRKTPVSLFEGAQKLSELTGIEVQYCQERLREFFLLGTQLKTIEGNSFFAFKLHQFIGQGRTVYATLQSQSKRFLTLEGQYFAPERKEDHILYPLLFCRVCGQDYYLVAKDPESGKFLPVDPQRELSSDTALTKGYLMLSPEGTGSDWSEEHLPPEWYDKNGKVKRDYRQHVPVSTWVFPDGTYKTEPDPGAVKGWYQPSPFILCLNCGEFYDRRGRDDFRKIAGLSSEGRSTATTVLSISSLQHAEQGGIREGARKILSFTDNRQDASLQAGHFNDFVQVSILRSAILAALEKHHELRFDNVAQNVVESMGLSLSHVAKNKDLSKDTAQGREVWNTFRDVVEYRLFEDLRRGWRVVQPNLEQCGLLSIDYRGLEELCRDDRTWDTLASFRFLPPETRIEVLKAVLDHFRRKLAISIGCLKEQYQQQLKKRALEQINERWSFDEKEMLRTASKFLLPGQPVRPIEGLSLGENSLIGRYLRRTLSISESYSGFIQKLTDFLTSHGLMKKDSERDVSFVQLDGTCLLWEKCTTGLPPSDPIYTRRMKSEAYLEAEREANEYFRKFYKEGAANLRDIEGREHTAQITYESRQEREQRFRDGALACLFCSPTMELGIDIADLQLVHLRNVPPTPANYAQRSGRAGRRGDPALILTYCGAGSGHDQYFFRHRQEMVSGVVRPPRIDLGNEDLIKAHIHALWLSKVRLSLGDSITDILELGLDNYPLKENIRVQIHLSEQRLKECFEEAERRRLGYEVTTQFRFAPSPGGQKRILEAIVQEDNKPPMLRMIYAPTAELYRINHGWRYRKEKGFLIDLEEGSWLKGSGMGEEDSGPPSTGHQDIVRLFVHDSHNLLLVYPLEPSLAKDEDLQATLQYCLQRGMEQVFQIEESEINSERIGSSSNRAILFWEASEGGVGVLRRLIEERDAIPKVTVAALERCHFDPGTLSDLKSGCFRACYECLLSYGNQRDYPRLNRHSIKDFLVKLSKGSVLSRKSGRDYEDHYRWLRSLTDSRSELKRKFIDHLYQGKRRLPDEGQKYLKDYYSNPDFFYEPNVCIFCDGSVHDEPGQKEKDCITRQELKDLGYRVIVIRYDQDLEEQIHRHPDVFG